MADYQTTLRNKQSELIRKSLDGSVFLNPDLSAASQISAITSYTGGATAAKVDGSAAAVAITTGGTLVLQVNGVQYGVVLLAADAPAAVVTKINSAVGAAATASLAVGVLRVESALVGSASSVKVVSGGGTVLANLFVTAGQSGVGNDGGVDLAPLPVGYDDLGWLSGDGAAFSRDVSTSEVTSWGSVSPTRTDITSDTTTMSVTAQETKLLTIGLATGVDLSALVPDPNTGEFSVAKPSRPKSKSYRVLSLSVDNGDAGEIYIARFLPRAKVTGYSEQSFGSGDDPVTWGVTFTGEEDSDLGYSERWIFGGPGWKSLLVDMGFA